MRPLRLVPLLFMSTALARPSAAQRSEGYVDAGGGVRLYYQTLGRGVDTVVVLHGGPGFSMAYLADDLEPLARRHTLIFYDQRGAGRSTLVTDSAALDGKRFAEDLEAVRRHFRLDRVALLGHSWGAGVAALYAMKYPTRIGRLVLVGAIPARQAELTTAFDALNSRRDSAEIQRMAALRAARLANPGDAAACRAYYVVWFRPSFTDSTSARRSKGDFCGGPPEALENKMRSVDRYVAASLGDWNWLPALRAVRAPALVIHGADDFIPLASSRAWTATLPDARLLILPRSGHVPYLDTPEPFFTAVDTFLRGGWPSGAAPVAAP